MASSWELTAEGFCWTLSSDRRPVGVGEAGSRVLNQLTDEEVARIDGEQVCVPHSDAARLPDDEAASLGLPPPFPFGLEIRSNGTLDQKDFAYRYYFLDHKGDPFAECERVGACLTVGGRAYLLGGDLHGLIEAIDSYNSRSADEKSASQNLLAFAEIDGLIGNAGAIVDTYLGSQAVISPTKLGVRLCRNDDGSLDVAPTLLDCGPDSDGSDGEDLTPSVDENLEAAFLRSLDRFGKTRAVYVLPGGPRVVLSEPQRKALKTFKSLRRVEGRRKETLLANPTAFFDPDVVSLDRFSDRVQEIGEHRPRVFPFLKPEKEPWLPPEGGIVVDGELVELTPESAKVLEASVREAIEQGSPTVDWQGKDLPATPELLDAIQQSIDLSAEVETSQPEELARLTERRGAHVLILRDNLEIETFELAGREVRPTPDLPLPLRSGVRLFDHQMQGLDWLRSLWASGMTGGLLADDMGLGKTLQVWGFLGWLRRMMDSDAWLRKPILIVAPVSLLQNWDNEYSKFLEPVFGELLHLHGQVLLDFKRSELAEELGAASETRIKDKDAISSMVEDRRGVLLKTDELLSFSAVLTTYETLRNYQFSLGTIDWACVVIDEAQKVKNPSAMVTNAVKAMRYDFAVAMTGTPVENSWVDLWSIMDFVAPGHLGSLKSFSLRYQNPLADPNTDRRQLGEDLQQEVGSLLKRRLKEDHLNGLPEKRVLKYEVEMPREQQRRYIDLVNKARSSDPLQRANTHIFSVLAALRDVSLCPYLPFQDDVALADRDAEQIIGSSARLLKTFEILEVVRKKSEKAVIFLASRKMQRLLQSVLKERFALQASIINGEVSGGRRQLLIDEFHGAPGFGVLIVSTEAGGVGLNITAANHVIHLSRPWNPAKEDQATDRVYRIGQTREVFVHIPMAVSSRLEEAGWSGTFDKKLDQLLESKRSLSRSVLVPSIARDEELIGLHNDLISDATAVPTMETAGGEGGESPEALDIEALDELGAEVFRAVVGQLLTQDGMRVEWIDKPGVRGILARPSAQDKRAQIIVCEHVHDGERRLDDRSIRIAQSLARETSQVANSGVVPAVYTNATGPSDKAMAIAAEEDVILVVRNQLSSRLLERPIRREDLLTLELLKRVVSASESEVDARFSEESLSAEIAEGETTRREFKSSLRWNIHTKKNDDRVIHAVLKTIAGFQNRDGGDLFIGVSDDGRVIGIEQDGFANVDRFVLKLTELVSSSMGQAAAGRIDPQVYAIDGRRICRVSCEPSSVPVYLAFANKESFYVRTGTATTEMTPSQMQDYIRERFG